MAEKPERREPTVSTLLTVRDGEIISVVPEDVFNSALRERDGYRKVAEEHLEALRVEQRIGVALEADRDALRAQLAHALAVWRERIEPGNAAPHTDGWWSRMEAALAGAVEERGGG